MPPPPKGGGFALLTARWRKAPPSGELLSAAKRRGFTPRETPPVISLCSMPDSPFCRCATSSPAPGEVIFGDGAFGMAAKFLAKVQNVRARQRLPPRGSWQNRQVLTEGVLFQRTHRSFSLLFRAQKRTVGAFLFSIFVFLPMADLKFSPPSNGGRFVVSLSRLWYTY